MATTVVKRPAVSIFFREVCDFPVPISSQVILFRPPPQTRYFTSCRRNLLQSSINAQAQTKTLTKPLQADDSKFIPWSAPTRDARKESSGAVSSSKSTTTKTSSLPQSPSQKDGGAAEQGFNDWVKRPQTSASTPRSAIDLDGEFKGMTWRDVREVLSKEGMGHFLEKPDANVASLSEDGAEIESPPKEGLGTWRQKLGNIPLTRADFKATDLGEIQYDSDGKLRSARGIAREMRRRKLAGVQGYDPPPDFIAEKRKAGKSYPLRKKAAMKSEVGTRAWAKLRMSQTSRQEADAAPVDAVDAGSVNASSRKMKIDTAEGSLSLIKERLAAKKRIDNLASSCTASTTETSTQRASAAAEAVKPAVKPTKIVRTEEWQKQKDSLKTKFPQGWSPPRRLSPEAMDGIRAVHSRYPDTYTTPVLAQHFKVSPEMIRRILRSSWKPNPTEEEDRNKRWQRRGERIWTDLVAKGAHPPKKWRQLGIGGGPRRPGQETGSMPRGDKKRKMRRDEKDTGGPVPWG